VIYGAPYCFCETPRTSCRPNPLFSPASSSPVRLLTPAVPSCFHVAQGGRREGAPKNRRENRTDA